MNNRAYEAIRNGSMVQRLKFLGSDTILYGGATAVNKMLSLFIVPVLTRFFSTAEYGAIDIIAVLGSVFIVVITMGQDSAVARFFYETENTEERKQIITQALISEIFLCLVVCSLLFKTADFLVAKLLAAPGYVRAFRVLVAGLPFVILVNFFRNLLKWTFSRRKFIFMSLGSFAVIISLTLIFVLILDLGVTGIFYAKFVGMAIFALIGVFFCHNLFAWPRNFHYGRKMILFGGPYMLIAAGSSMIPALDRSFISHFLGLETMGLYAVGWKLALAVTLVLSAFQIAWGPFSMAIYKEPYAASTYNKVLLYYAITLSLMAFCLVAIAKPLTVLIASARYARGSIVILPLTFGIIVQTAAWITGIGVDLSKKTYYHIISYLIGLSISALVIWSFIRTFGMLGVAYGVMIGQVTQGAISTFFAYRVYHFRFLWKVPCIVLTLSFALSVLMQLISFSSPILQACFRISLFALLLGIIWKYVLSPKERGFILRKLKNSLKLAIG